MLRVPIWLLSLIAGTLAALAVWAWHLRSELADAEATVAGYKEAARLLDAHLKFVDSERRKWQTIAETLDTVEGVDEPLNPYERAVLDCVRSGKCNP